MDLWKLCPMLKCMSNLHDCYWPCEIFISGLQIVECPILVPIFFLVCLCYCWHYSQSLGLERAWLKRSQFHPIQYLHKLRPLLFLPNPPLPLPFTWTFFTARNISMHTHTHTHTWNTHQTVISLRDSIYILIGKSLPAEITHSHRVCCAHAAELLCSPEAAIPVHCMPQPPAMCVLMNVFPFNSGMKTLLKEIPSLILNMPIAALSLLLIITLIYIHLLFLNAFSPFSAKVYTRNRIRQPCLGFHPF